MYDTIVTGTDGSATAERAVRRAADLAKRNGGRIHVVSAYLDPDILRERLGASARYGAIPMREVAEQVLERAAGHIKAEGLEVETHARKGDPAEAIIDVAEEHGADLIVVGNQGVSGIRRFMLGSVPSKIAHHAPCDVMIVHTT